MYISFFLFEGIYYYPFDQQVMFYEPPIEPIGKIAVGQMIYHLIVTCHLSDPDLWDLNNATNYKISLDYSFSFGKKYRYTYIHLLHPE